MMTEVQNVHIHTADGDDGDEVISWQMHHILSGTSFDSFNDHWPSQCHEDTRTDIRGRARHWIHNGGLNKKLFWLFGPAGVGKTTIMRAIAEAESNHYLAAAVFFSKTEPNYLNRIFPTISYHLSLKDPSYRAYIGELRRTDPFYWKKTLKSQFEKLFVVPCSQRKVLSNTQPWVIMLDGLDECRDAAGEGDRTYELAQRTIILLISTFIQDHPWVPLVWMIASRPEDNIVTTFSLSSVAANTFREFVSVDSTEACRDVELYLKSALSHIVQQYPSHFDEQECWPSKDDIALIARAACGLFIFAVVVVRFIQDRSVGNPRRRLTEVLSVIQRAASLSGHSRSANPFATLDMMYIEILQRISSAMYENTRELLTYSFFKGSSYPLVQICNLMAIERPAVYAAVQDLHSVLDIPDPHLAYQYNVRVFHSSFYDFLLDTTRSKNFGIGQAQLTKATGDYWRAYFRILQQAVGHSISGILLAWRSGNLGEDEQMQLRLLDEAQNCWTSSFTKLLPIDPSTIGLAGTPNFPICIPISDLLEILGQVHFNKLDEYMPQSSSSVPFDFLDSLRNLCDLFPEEVEQSDLVEHVTLDTLDLDHVDPGDRRIRYVLGPSGVQKETWDFDLLRSRKKVFASTPVMIWGRIDSLKGALFKLNVGFEEDLNARTARPCKLGGTGDFRYFENGDHREQSFPAEDAQCRSAWEVYFLAYPSARCELRI